MSSERREVAVIPARYDSRRFPGKPLASILGRPMIEWVVEGVVESRRIDEVWVATDDERIARAVETTPARSVMTSPDHQSGSDRVAEVARDLDVDVVVNVQGDEPLIRGVVLDRGLEALEKDPRARMASFHAPCPSERVENTDVAKVVMDQDQRALYFSRAPIPHHRSGSNTYRQHIGTYLFERDFLLSYSEWSSTPLEQSEKLEQLRVLERGHAIRMIAVEEPTVGVDRPEDIETVEKALRERGHG